MDRKQLREQLQAFQLKCLEKGRPIAEICLEEAYPGDSSTSYIVQVKALWIDGLDCYSALDFLFDILFETTNEETRKKIFSIQVLDSTNELHCESQADIVNSLSSNIEFIKL